jgi:hypothetical protein
MSGDASAAPRPVKGCEWIAYDASGGLIFPFGDPGQNYWMRLGIDYTGLVFVIVPSLGSTTAYPEATFNQADVDTGPLAPESFTATVGVCQSRAVGLDIMHPYWRLSLNGGRGQVAILGIPR